MSSATIAENISEKQLLSTVIDLLRFKGWMAYTVFEAEIYARRSDKGYPDITAVRTDGLGAILFIELKSQRGRISADQQRWAEALRNNTGAIYYLWRPSDLLDGTIEQILEEVTP